VPPHAYRRNLPPPPLIGEGEEAVHAEVTYQYVHVRRYGLRRAPSYRTDPTAGLWVLKPRIVITPLGRRVRVLYLSAERGEGICDIEYRPLINSTRTMAIKRYWVRKSNTRYIGLLQALDMEINERIMPITTNPYEVGGAAAQSRLRLIARLASVQIAADAAPEPPRVQADVFLPPPEGAKDYWSDTLFTSTPTPIDPNPEGEDRD